MCAWASLDALAECTSLQSLHIESASGDTISDLGVILPSLARLEYLRITAARVGEWDALACCIQLTRLDIDLKQVPDMMELAPYLSWLPCFTALELTLFTTRRLQHQPRSNRWVLEDCLLRAIDDSASWHTLQLHIDSSRGIDEWDRESSDLALCTTPMSAAAEQRLHVMVDVVGRRAVRTFRIARDEEDRPIWRDQDGDSDPTPTSGTPTRDEKNRAPTNNRRSRR